LFKVHDIFKGAAELKEGGTVDSVDFKDLSPPNGCRAFWGGAEAGKKAY
jgi:hypothetical protein